MSSLVHFSTGTRQELDSYEIDDGGVYFIPDANDGMGDIAFDLDGVRSWVTSSKILETSELDESVPRLGELIVVVDGLVTIDEISGETTELPGLKIGDGVASVSALPYLNDGYRVNKDVLGEQYSLLKDTVDDHIADTNIHHTTNARLLTNNTLEILNYDSLVPDDDEDEPTSYDGPSIVYQF